MATRTPAKKSTAKPAAKRAARPKPSTTGKGRTSKALKNRHQWSNDELTALAAEVNAAGYGQKQPIFEAWAKKIGNGIGWQSVRAQFYAFESGRLTTKGAPASGLSAAPALSTDPVERVKGMVKRRGQVVREHNKAATRMAQIAETLAALKAEAEGLSATMQAAQAELDTLDGALGQIG